MVLAPSQDSCACSVPVDWKAQQCTVTPPPAVLILRALVARICGSFEIAVYSFRMQKA